MNRNKNFRKSQASIEFIGGFILFVAVIMYVAFSIINSLPTRQDAIDENTMRLQAWRISENFMRAVDVGGTIDDGKLLDFTLCQGYNYNDLISRQRYEHVKSILNVSESRYIHILIEQFPVAIMESGDNAMRNGAFEMGGARYHVDARNTSSSFDEARVEGGFWVPIGGIVPIGGNDYVVAAIGPKGEFVIFQRKLVSCGPHT